MKLFLIVLPPAGVAKSYCLFFEKLAVMDVLSAPRGGRCVFQLLGENKNFIASCAEFCYNN
jgi:hypothetical protein